MTTIEGLGKKFQEARLARGLTLDEAARMTKIRPSRLAEIETDDFSQFPSLAYAKGFLLIYGKFLEVDVTPYMEAFEGSDAGVTVDGYSYLQDNPTPAPARAPIVRRRPARVRAPAPASGQRTSIMPLILVPAVIIAGFLGMRLILNLQRLAPQHIGEAPTTQVSPTVAPSAPIAAIVPSATPQSIIAPSVQAAATAAASVAPTAPPVIPSATPVHTPAAIVAASPPAPSPPPKPSAKPSAAVVAKLEPEVRRAEPVRPEDLASAGAAATAVAPRAASPAPSRAASPAAASPAPSRAASPAASASASPAAPVASSPAASAATAETGGPNKIAIRSLKKTYVRVVVDDENATPAYERWLSPSDPPVEFRGQHINIKVLERDALQIKKNGKAISGTGDDDVTIE